MTEACQALDRAVLLFRSADAGFPDGAPDVAADYYPVVSWVAADAGTPGEAAEAFAEHTHSVQWQHALRRSVRPGDALQIGRSLFLFADEAQAQRLARSGRPAARLPRFLHLWLVNFSPGT